MFWSALRFFIIRKNGSKNGYVMNCKIEKWCVSMNDIWTPGNQVFHCNVVPTIPRDVVINGVVYWDSLCDKELGIIYNTNLTWDDHINSLVGQTVYQVTHTFFIPLNMRILIAKTYLISCLMYGCELFGNCDSSSKRKLNVPFNNIVRYSL